MTLTAKCCRATVNVLNIPGGQCAGTFMYYIIHHLPAWIPGWSHKMFLFKSHPLVGSIVKQSISLKYLKQTPVVCMKYASQNQMLICMFFVDILSYFFLPLSGYALCNYYQTRCCYCMSEWYLCFQGFHMKLIKKNLCICVNVIIYEKKFFSFSQTASITRVAASRQPIWKLMELLRHYIMGNNISDHKGLIILYLQIISVCIGKHIAGYVHKFIYEKPWNIFISHTFMAHLNNKPFIKT